MRVRLRVLLPIATMLVAWGVQFSWPVRAQQVSGGRAAYEQDCATCHGANLRQLPEAPLTGREFAAKWGSRNSELVALIRSTMPPGSPGALPAETYTAIAAYLLQATDASAAAPPTRRTGVTVAGTVPGFVRVTDATLRTPNPADWLMIRRDYSATSYSPLTQITAANASRLELAWTWPMREGGFNQPAPLVYNGTM